MMKSRKYKGFVLEPVFYVGSGCKTLRCGRIVERTQTRHDIEYWEIIDPMENNRRHGAETTLQECKDRIDAMLKDMNMKDNTPASWAALEKEVAKTI